MDFLRIIVAVVTTVIRQHVVATGVMVALVLSGCRADPQERALQGMWYYRDPHLANIPAESALEERWIFDRGSFRYVACCFIQVRESGSYVILDQENGTLTLELYNLSGDRQGQSISSRETRQIRVVIDLQSDTLKIGRSGPFIRLTPLESDRE